MAALGVQDWQLPLGRRFRALKLWFVMRSYGAEALRAFIRHHLQLTEQFVALVNADERFELTAPPLFSLTCFAVKVCADLRASLRSDSVSVR